MEDINLIIITGTAFTLLIIGLAALIIFSAQRKKDKLQIEMQELELQKQKEISENTLVSQEKERQRISLELHDELGPSFAATRMDIARIKEMVKHTDKQEKVVEIAEQAEQSLSGAIAQFSNLTRMLYPVILNRFGLEEALNDIIDKARQSSEINFELNTAGLAVDRDVVSSSIYRICQELSTNAIKHSEATEVIFNLDQDDVQIRMEYQDNGKGYNTSEIFEGLGLNSIKGRIDAIGGELEVESAPDQGLHINIAIPYER